MREREIAVIPMPQKVEFGDGTFSLCNTVFISGKSQIVEKAAYSLNKRGLDPQFKSEGVSADVQFILSSKDESKVGDLPIDTPGAYCLSVGKEGVIISAYSQNGWFNGLQTLLQLIDTSSSNENGFEIPIVCITDWPRFEWRVFMLDESRHFSGLEAVKRLLDTMAYYKLNIFHWHLTDSPGWRVEIKTKPELTIVGSKGNFSDHGAPNQFYTQEQIREVVAFAKDRHIELMPEIGMPGHMSAAMRSYPEFSGGGYDEDPYFTIDPISDSADKFLKSILDEVAELFIESNVIHFGGDEVFAHRRWNAHEGVQKLIEEGAFADEREIESAFNRRMAEYINDLGFVVGGWDEIFESGLEVEGTLIFWWHHDRPEVLSEILDKGYRVILCPRRPQYFDFIQHETHTVGRTWGGHNPLEDVYRFPESLKEYEIHPMKGNVAGISANLWTEQANSQERRDFLTFPRLLAMAEAAWTAEEKKGWGQFIGTRLRNHIPLLEARGLSFFNPYIVSNEIPE